MRHYSDRKILVKKEDLISKIKENQEKHVTEYEKAVASYREEAKKQLERQLKRLEEGKLTIKLNLVKPINKTDEYSKLIEMFNWETRSEIELSQGEFNQYIFDEFEFSLQAKLANTAYLNTSFESDED